MWWRPEIRGRCMALEKPLVVLIDSPDRCGKTEIATALSYLTGIPYFKNRGERPAFVQGDSSYFTNVVRYGEPFLIDHMKQTGTSAIHDRSYPSEYVYSRVMGRTTDDEAIRYIDGLYAGLGARIIIPVRSGYSGRSDDLAGRMITSDQMTEQHNWYLSFAGWTKCKCLVMNVDDEDINREIEEIVSFLEECQGEEGEK